MTLVEARAVVDGALRTGEGVECPCCEQLVKPYRRSLNHVNIRTMVWMYRTAGLRAVHIPTLMSDYLPEFAHQGGHATLAHYWGLLVETGPPRDDGGRAGWWKLHTDAESFLHDELDILKYAVTYNGRCLRFEGEYVNAQHCLGRKFDLALLMSGGDR